LKRNEAHILEQLALEEDRFQRTLRKGTGEFEKVYQNLNRAREAFEKLRASVGRDAAENFLASVRPTPEMLGIIEEVKKFLEGGDASALSDELGKYASLFGAIDGRSAFTPTASPST